MYWTCSFLLLNSTNDLLSYSRIQDTRIQEWLLLTKSNLYSTDTSSQFSVDIVEVAPRGLELEETGDKSKNNPIQSIYPWLTWFHLIQRNFLKSKLGLYLQKQLPGTPELIFATPIVSSKAFKDDY